MEWLCNHRATVLVVYMILNGKGGQTGGGLHGYRLVTVPL